ncbi:MAG: Ig-like domain-containing protein, partial [Thiotrichaceae bacterium]
MGSIQVSKRLLSSLLVLSTLTACGGGGTTNGNNDDDGNTIPTAQDVTTTTPEDTPKLVTLDATDSDGDTLTYIKVTDPAHGTLSIQNNILTYTPDTNYNGSDSFTYKINDGTGDSNIATASITIEATNDIPTANTQSVTTAEDTTKAITLTGSDPDNDSLSYIKVTDPSNGTVSFSGATATYAPNGNYNGSDSFTYKVNDGTVDSAVVTVSISVGATNDAPTANTQSVTTAEDTTKAITLTGSDPDNDSLSYIKVTDPSNGTVSFN